MCKLVRLSKYFQEETFFVFCTIPKCMWNYDATWEPWLHNHCKKNY